MVRVLIAALAALSVAACGNETSGKTEEKPKRRAAPPHLVELKTVESGRLDYTAIRAGSLRAQREVKIINEEEGRLMELAVREGDRVKPGMVLARYDDRILRAQVDKAVATRKQAESDLARSRQMRVKGFVSEDAVTRASTVVEVALAEERLLRARAANMVLTAPFAGVVSQRLVDPGNATARHTHLLTVIDPSTLVTDVTVSELVIPHLTVGDVAQVRIDALGETLHAGRILRIHPSIDPATRTGKVEVTLDPVPEGARAGQFCRVTLATGLRDQLVIPLAALQRDREGEHVFLYQPDGKVRRVGVETGFRLADRVEIRAGLKKGDQIVLKGFIGLKPGQTVTPVSPEGAAAAPANGAAGGKGKGGKGRKGGKAAAEAAVGEAKDGAAPAKDGSTMAPSTKTGS